MFDITYGIKELPSEEELYRLLSKVKIRLFYEKGAAFLSSLMSNTEFYWDDSIPTAATNGLQMFWNPYFFLKIPVNARVFVLAHELWHNAYLHNIRRGDRDPKLYNIAADHVINTKLLSEGYDITGIPFDIYSDFQYHEWSVDRVYEDIAQNSPPPPPMSGMFGLADDIKEPGSTDTDGSSESSDTSASSPSPEEVEAKMIGNLVQAIQASKLSGERGVIPGDIEEMVDEILSPILPWDTLLHQFLTELSQEDYSYRRPSRRYDEPFLPSLITDGGLQELNWYLDVSGSVTEEMIKRFFSEMVYVKYTYHPEKINIIEFDYEIQKEITLDADDSFDFLDIKGRGGTWLDPVREHILKTQPNAAIIFSDLECPPMEKVDVPVLWAVFCEGKGYSKYAHRPTFGTVIEVREIKV